uniref:Zinc-binding protein A33-like n=1 Tax=Labrus bergylta TaxID=56723 RepID=A0A3Q3EVT4_9LABR|nr:zinc-binding protein A33-like [Labrus bergylta]
MAEKIALVESFLNCHVCLETFKDPVSLSCNHSFCSSCLQTCWEQAKNKNCPICKRTSLIDVSEVNLTLKELADSFAERKTNGSPEGEKDPKKDEVVCNEHPDVPYWFCEDEDRAVCPVCEFSLHHGHKLLPVEEAVADLKEQLKSDLKSLQDKREKHKQVEETYNEVIQHSKKQLLSTERQIKAEFKKLQQFLKEEEESRLAALREEEEQKGKTISRELKKIQEQISSLSQSICAVEEELQKHSVSFLSSYKPTQSRARVQCSVSDPQLVSGALIDVAKHLGNLSFKVWEKMRDRVHFSPVILDPNTAHPWLYLSHDLTSVRWEDTKKQLPDNPERNIKYTTVLGSEGFSSGEHSWEVEVGDHPYWNVGLAKESVDRKGERYARPESGIWCLSHHSGKYTNGLGKTVRMKKNLQRVRVQLDYDRGELSFYDSEDMTHIDTHRKAFTGTLFPLIETGAALNAKTAEIKICHRDFSVMIREGGEV